MAGHGNQGLPDPDGMTGQALPISGGKRMG